MKEGEGREEEWRIEGGEESIMREGERRIDRCI